VADVLQACDSVISAWCRGRYSVQDAGIAIASLHPCDIYHSGDNISPLNFVCLPVEVNKNISINVYIQCILDTLLVTSLVYATGGIESSYSTLYPLIIIYSALFLGKKGAAFIASTCSIFYGLLVDLEFYGVIHPIYSETYQYNAEAGHVFLADMHPYCLLFIMVALLASFVVEMKKDKSAPFREGKCL